MIVSLPSVRERQRRVVGGALGLGRGGAGEPLADGAQHQPHLDDGEHAVDERETDHRGEHLRGGHARRHPRGGRHQAEDDPGLAAHLGEDPAERVREQRQQRRGDHHREPEPGASLGGRQVPLAEQDQHDDADGHAEQPQADHQPEGPVGDRDGRGVRHRIGDLVAVLLADHRGVLGVVLLTQRVDALHGAGERPGGQEGRHARDLDREDLLRSVQGADGEQREGRRGLGLPDRLGRRHLHRLDIGHHLALQVTGDGDQGTGDDQHPGTELGGPGVRGGVLGVLTGELADIARPGGAGDLQQVPAGHTHHEGAADHVRGGQRVRDGGQGHRVGQHGAEVGHLGAAAGLVEGEADGVLHEGVGRQDEDRAQHGADRGQPDRREVHALGQPVAAEDPDAEEGGLHEEGQQRLESERGAEDVADHPGVLGPVHPELELLDDAGDDTHGEVDQEQLAEEIGQPTVLVLAGAVVRGLQDGNDQGQ
ncbi:hypothetical protein SDC9_76117 [bioreactor metagenome]|uniref:Uncharacterized protein n=1 Tax=bioreactor metagenome TaxID=1076179 RepID=A0A644YMQ4_9ZZZZ